MEREQAAAAVPTEARGPIIYPDVEPPLAAENVQLEGTDVHIPTLDDILMEYPLETRERVATLLSHDPTIIIARDAAGRIDEEAVYRLYQEGKRQYRVAATGEKITVQTDEVVEALFDHCRQLGVRCGVSGSDVARGIAGRKPTNIKLGSDLDIVVPTDDELLATGIPEASDAIIAQKRYAINMRPPHSLSRRQIRFLSDAQQILGDGIYFDAIGTSEGLMPFFTTLPSTETSHQLILRSDGMILGDAAYVRDAVDNVLRYTGEPTYPSTTFRFIRFASEDPSITLDPTSLRYMQEYTARLFDGEIKLQDLERGSGAVSFTQLQAQYGRERAMREFHRILTSWTSYNINKEMAKMFANSRDLDRTIQLLKEVGWHEPLQEMGYNFDGIVSIIREQQAAGRPMTIDDIWPILEERGVPSPQIAEEEPLQAAAAP